MQSTRNTTRKATRRAQSLRKGMGETERKLWQAIRRQTLGFKFRRQYPVDCYVVDFYCVDARLAVEVDGEHHQHRVEADDRRDEWLATEHGIQTVRFRTIDVLENLEAVLEVIYRECCARSGRNPLQRDLGVERDLPPP